MKITFKLKSVKNGIQYTEFHDDIMYFQEIYYVVYTKQYDALFPNSYECKFKNGFPCLMGNTDWMYWSGFSKVGKQEA